MVGAVLGLPTTVENAWTLVKPFAVRAIEGIIVLVIFLLLARFLRNLASRLLARRSVRTDAVLLVTRAIYVGVLALGLVMFAAVVLGQLALGVAGVLLAALLTSLGLQDLIKSYVSGFYVLMEKNIRVGDLVESGGYRGVVTDVRMRVTYLRGAQGEMVVVPNSELFTKTLVVSQAPPDWGSGGEGPQHDPEQGAEVVVR
jgi:small-conductance mechanosensitive channel